MKRFTGTLTPVRGGGHGVAVPPEIADAVGLRYGARVHVKHVIEAKKPQTRARRIAATVAALAPTRGRPR
ncbi:MAG: YdeI/OmpD-associated family protein [Acidobacteriota bacterium]